MRRLQFFYKQFTKEPLWFRMVVSITFLASIVLSSSAFSLGGYSGSISKLAAAIFLCIFGMKMRRNLRISLLFFALAAFSLYVSWDALP